MIKNFNAYNNSNNKRTQQFFLKVLREGMPHAFTNGIPTTSLVLSCLNCAVNNMHNSSFLWKQIVNNRSFIRSFSTDAYSKRPEQEQQHKEEASKSTSSSSARSKTTPEEEEEEEQVKRSGPSGKTSRTTTTTTAAGGAEEEPELTRRTGRRNKKDFIQNKKGFKTLFYFCFAMWFVSYFYPIYIQRRRENGKGTWYQKFQDRYDRLTGKEPSQFLLPELDPNIPPQEMKPVLVFNINDILLHSEYVPDEGYRWVKRKGLEDFIKQMSEVYEVVLFADDTLLNIGHILEKVDPEERAFKLFRDQAYYIDGKWIKDLKLLGRPLEKIVFVEWNPDAFSLQPENALQVHRWEGVITPADDKYAEKLALLLKYLSQFQDLRSALKVLKQRLGTEDGEELINRFYQHVNQQQGRSDTSAEATTTQATTAAPSGGKNWLRFW